MKTGDRVVCVDARTHPHADCNCPLVEGRDYLIYDILVCSCGHLFFDVGLPGKKSVGWAVSCKCKAIIPTSIWFLDSLRFRKVEEKREYLVVKSNIEIEKTVLS